MCLVTFPPPPHSPPPAMAMQTLSTIGPVQPPEPDLPAYEPRSECPRANFSQWPQELAHTHLSSFAVAGLTLRCEFDTRSQSVLLPTVVIWLTTCPWLTSFPFLSCFLDPLLMFPRFTSHMIPHTQRHVSRTASGEPKLRHSYYFQEKSSFFKGDAWTCTFFKA